MLSDKIKSEIEKTAARYHTRKSACMAALQIIQREKINLTEDDLRDVAALLDIKPVEVEEVTGFYTMYNVDTNVGKNHIQVCANISCSLMGAEHIIKAIERTLGIKTGETTADKKFTLTTVECLGSCGTAPMMQVNDDFYENLTEEKVVEVLKKLE